MRVQTQPISFSLTNTRRLNAAQSALFTPDSDYETERASDIYLITEPWWRVDDDPDAPHFSVKEPAGLYPILPAQTVPASSRPRVFAYATNLRLDFEVFNRYDLAQDLDFLILEIRQGSHPPFLVVDLYNQDPPEGAGDLGRTFERFMQLDLPDMPILIAMDANEHHSVWDSFAARSSRGAEAMLAWMEEHGFSVLNDPDVSTWRKDDFSQRSVLDLLWQNERMAELGVLQDLAVSDIAHPFSDHHTLSWRVVFAQEDVDVDSGAKYNFKHADKDEFQNDFRLRLDEHSAVFDELRIAPRGLRDIQLLERATEAMHSALGAAAEATVPKRRPCKRSQPWWTPELTASQQRMHDAEIAAQSFARLHRRSSPALAADATRERNYHQRHIKRTKRDYYNTVVEEATVEDIWDMRKWSQGKRGYRSPDICAYSCREVLRYSRDSVPASPSHRRA